MLHPDFNSWQGLVDGCWLAVAFLNPHSGWARVELRVYRCEPWEKVYGRSVHLRHRWPVGAPPNPEDVFYWKQLAVAAVNHRQRKDDMCSRPSRNSSARR